MSDVDDEDSETRDGWIHLDGAVNVRDLGGLPTADGRRTKYRRLLRADNLQDLSPADVRRLLDDFDVRQVLDLRTAAEIELEGPGPITRERDVTVRELTLYPEAGRRTDALTEDVTGVSGPALPWTSGRPEPLEIDATERPAVVHYLGYLRHAADNIVESLRTIGQCADGATLVHCAAGKDRTGMVIAMALLAVGVRREHVVADYARSGEVIGRIMERLASTTTYAADVSDAEGNPVTDANMDPATWNRIADRQRPRAETMQRVLELLDERAGGPIQWLSDAGLTEHEQQELRAHLLG